MATKISYRDVINFFDEINGEMADLVLGIIEDNMAKKAERKAKMSANLKKARAAKGKTVTVAARTVETDNVKADPNVQAETEQQLPVHRSPGRPRRVAETSDPIAVAVGE
jgi:hypothetical protein